MKIDELKNALNSNHAIVITTSNAINAIFNELPSENNPSVGTFKIDRKNTRIKSIDRGDFCVDMVDIEDIDMDKLVELFEFKKPIK
jgi:hypothetical protein